MNNNEKERLIRSFLDKNYKDAKCELNYKKDYELLISVILSAQTTDKKVNEVTANLFLKYRSLDDFNLANINELEKDIKSLGLYKNKAKSIKNIAYSLINEFNYKVPDTKKELLSINGVGEKSANVVLIELFDKDEFPVDTHIYRISYRLGIRKESDSIKVAEMKLRRFFKKDFKKLHHEIISFGRDKCKAINPICQKCELKKICNYKKESKTFR